MIFRVERILQNNSISYLNVIAISKFHSIFLVLLQYELYFDFFKNFLLMDDTFPLPSIYPQPWLWSKILHNYYDVKWAEKIEL